MQKTNLFLPLFLCGSVLFAQEKTKPEKSPEKTMSQTIVSVPAAGTAKLLETVTKKGNELVIPYKKYQLPNGLTIVVHEDHSDPVAYVDVTYHVGSAREQEGRSGFAHFFEHMMFQGSKHVADEMHFKVVTEAGGTLNGTTNTDRTNYFETAPSNQLETMIWLEADRMGFLLDSVTQAKFEIQRATVKNERGQRYDNAPYGVVGEKTGEALYPQGHPYSWTTIGYIEDLNRVDVNDLKRFYMRWYGCNNATLTVAGDVNTDQVVKLAEKYFGSIPRGPEVKPQVIAPVKLTEDRYISYEDNVKFPLIQLVWPTVGADNNDEPALDVLSSILSDGKSSPFYTKLIKAQKAISANVYNSTRELAGQFEIRVRANKDAALADMEKEIRQLLTEWESKGISDDEIQKFKAGYQSDLYNGLTTVQGKGSQLAAYQTYRGNPNSLGYDLNRYMKVTKEDVMRVYNTYIKNQKGVILSCVPKGKSNLKAHEDTWKMYPRNIQKESSEYQNLSYNEPKDSFDRSKKPVSGENVVINVPKYWTNNFPNGIKLIGVKSDDVPKVNIQISLSAGHRYEPADKSGLAYLTTDLMNESTQLHTAEQISDMLNKLGSNIDVSANASEVVLYITSLSQNVDATIKIAEEMLFKPKFDNEEFERVKKQLQDYITQQNALPVAIADRAYNKLLYGEGHIMSYPVVGTAETVKSITLDDIKKYYAEHFSPSVAKVVVTGDITKEQVLPKLAFLQAWKDIKIVKPTEPALPKIDKTHIYFVDKKGAPQSEIRACFMAFPYDVTGEYYKSSIMNFPFGGAFNCRVNINLREQHGFTYGARAGFNGNIFDGMYAMSSGVRANATDSSLVEFLKEMKNYADNGITDEELSFTKNSMGQADALKYEAPQQKAGFMKRILDYNLDASYVDAQNKILKSITKEEINQLAKKNLKYNNMIIVVVGDKESNLEKVKKLGYEVIELDLNWNPVK